MKTKATSHIDTPAVPIPVASKLVLSPLNAPKHDAITETQIRELAYRLYEERGRIDGNDVQNWLEAETILRERGKLVA